MKKILIVLATIGILISCINEIDDLTFTIFRSGVSFPLGDVTMNANMLTSLGDSLSVREGNSSVIELFYEKEILRTKLNDRFTLSDQIFNDEIPFSAFIFSAGQTNEVKLSQYNSITIDNSDLADPAAALTLAVFSEGIIEVGQQKDFSHNVETTILFPTLIKDGVPLEIVTTNNSSVTANLTGYSLDMKGSTGNQVNTIDYEISTTVTESGASTLGTISFNFSMSELNFSYLEGDFHTYEFDEIQEEFDLSLPENEIPDNVKFTNPRIRLIVENTSGMEYGLKINEISVMEDNGDILQVTGTYANETAIVPQAAQRGETSINDFEINNNNADNLVALLSGIPKSASFRGVAITNPNGTSSGGNFIEETSEVVINSEIIIPLEGYANNYAINDTINDIDFRFDDEGIVSLDNINLRFQAENSFPLNFILQVYFLDTTAQQSIIDSVFVNVEDQIIIPAGTVDAAGLAISSNTKTSDIVIDQEKYEKIKFSKTIHIKASLLTPGANESPSKSVKFTTDNSLTLGIGLSGNAIIDPNQIDNNN